VDTIEKNEKRNPNGIDDTVTLSFGFNNRIIFKNEQANIIKSIGSMGSFFGAIFAAWKVFNVFLLNKYRNL
jgi:hypothetical protein